MDIDDLKRAWRTLDERLEATLAVNASLLREAKLDRTQSALRPLMWRLWAELVVASAAAVLLGAFAASRWPVAGLVIPAVVLHAAAIAAIASAAGQLYILRAIDYAQPVVSIQKALTSLAVWRGRDVRWQLLLMLPLWTPFAIVVLDGLFGVDVYRWFGTRWIIANLAFAIAMTPFMIWLVRRMNGRIRREGILKSLADDLTGRRLAVAVGHLEEVRRFDSAAPSSGRGSSV